MHTTWVWPDTLIDVVVVLVLMVVSYQLVTRLSRRLVHSAVSSHEKHRSSPEGAGLTSQLWRRASGLNNPRQMQRTKTLGAMMSSVAGFLIVGIGAMTILSLLGLPMGPLLTSAGIGGVAIGFGAQSLVKDFLSGVFLIAEDQFGVGDVVDLGTVKGTIEDVGLRVTRLRDATGEVWYIRNGEINQVGNVSQGWSNANVQVLVSSDEQPSAAIEVIRKAMHELSQDEEVNVNLLEEPRVLGVESITGTTMIIQVVAKCLANQQWGVQREIRERAKVALDEAGISGPKVPIASTGTGVTGVQPTV